MIKQESELFPEITSVGRSEGEGVERLFEQGK